MCFTVVIVNCRFREYQNRNSWRLLGNFFCRKWRMHVEIWSHITIFGRQCDYFGRYVQRWLFVSLRVSKLKKTRKRAILQVHNGVQLIIEVAPPPIKAWPLCSSQWMKGHKVWLKPKALWAYTQARWKTCYCGIFCSRFHPILSPLKIILEMVFWTNLMLDLICTWLEKTRRFCRQVNKKISSCFWTASTCVQRSSLGWCSRLKYGNRGLDLTLKWPSPRGGGFLGTQDLFFAHFTTFASAFLTVIFSNCLTIGYASFDTKKF